ncbi:hypothetical protein FXO37_07721 [Capsicum annuum]|nr:hypothetical protein FXO37_07721 [Capsicum annuum]
MKIFLKKKTLKKSPSQKKKKIKKIQKKRKAKEIEGLTKVDEDVQISFDDDSEDVSEEEGMPLAIQVWLYECCSNVPPKTASKVDNWILRLLNWKKIAPRPRFEFLMNALFNDDGKVDSPTPVVKKPLRKNQVDSFDEHTQTRTPAPRAAKADGMKTSIFKSIPTRQTSSSKTAKEKQTTRVIFPQVHSKPDIHVEEVTVSKPESHVDKQAFISKKDFDAFRDEEQVEDIEADKAANVDGGGLEKSGQHFSPDVQSSNNISDGTKGCTVLNSEKMNVEIDSQQLIPDELLQSINLDYLYSEKVVQHDCQINREITDSEVEPDTEEQVRTPPNTQDVTNDEQRDEKLWPDSQNNIPDEFLPSLNVYNHKSIIIHPSANREVKTPIPKLRIRRPSKFKE